MDEARRIYPDQAGLTFCDSAYETLDGCDALVIVTEWQEFRSPDFDLIARELSEPVVFDGRNLYDPDFLESIGIRHYGVGRGNSVAAPQVVHQRRRKTDSMAG